MKQSMVAQLIAAMTGKSKVTKLPVKGCRSKYLPHQGKRECARRIRQGKHLQQ